MYGWVQDRFGVSWQLYLDTREDLDTQQLIPTLMFTEDNAGKALHSMQFYTQIFPNSEVSGIMRYKDGENRSENPEYVQHAQFIIDDYILYCMDSSYSHHFSFNQGISLVVETSSQMETDHLWSALLQHGGQAKTRKVCFSTKRTKAFTTNNAARKAVIKPSAILVILSAVSTFALRIKSKVAAPSIVGIARKKENSVAALRESPANIPPTIVAPDLDVPGIMATH